MTYSKIDPDSLDSASSALDLLKPPETITSVLERDDRDVNPEGDPNGTQLDFQFRTSAFKYLDPADTRLLVRGKVVKADGSDIEDADNCTVTTSCNLLHTLFISFILSIGGHDVAYGSNYPWQAYFGTLFSRSTGFKRTIAAAQGWIEDNAGRINRAAIAAGHGADLKERKQLIASSKEFELCGGLNIPFFNQNRYLLPNTEIKLRLNRSSDKLCLLSTSAADTGDYKIILTKVTLIASEVTVNPSIINAQMALLASGKSVMYPVNYVETRMFTLPAGLLSHRVTIQINQQVPNRLTFGFVKHNATNGSTAEDPFRLEHYDVRRVALDLDGRPIPHRPLEMNFATGAVAHAYYNLARAAGRAHDDVDHGITMKQFRDGFTAFMFDLTPDGCHGSGVHLIKHGSLSIDLTFGTALPDTVSLIVFTERTELYKFDNNRTLTKLPRI